MTAPVPDASEEWMDAIIGAVRDDALACGWCERVTTHEPVSTPGHGITCAIWVQAGPNPLARASGLNASSALLVLNVRLSSPATAEPRDEMDPGLAKAVSALMRRWHDNYDFGLHPLVRNVDLLGQSGTQLSSRSGWVRAEGGGVSRAMVITLPIIINDVWPTDGS